MMDKGRIRFIDVAKGIAISLVVLGHCAVTALGDHSRLFYTIYAFHMPFCFFLSGILYSTKDWKQYLSGKVKALLLPYLFFSIVNVFSYQILNVIDCSGLRPFVQLGGLWFLLSLFYIVVIYFVLDTYFLRICGDKTKKIVLTFVACLLFVGGIGGGKGLPISSLSTTMVCFFFFHVGTLLRAYKSTLIIKSNSRRLIVLVISLVLVMLLIYTAPMNPEPVDVNYGRYGNKLMFVIQALLGIAGFLMLALSIKKSKALEYLGRNSLLILVIHIPLWHIFDFIINYKFGMVGYIQLICVFLCVFTLTLLLLQPINRFFPELKGEFDFNKV